MILWSIIIDKKLLWRFILLLESPSIKIERELYNLEQDHKKQISKEGCFFFSISFKGLFTEEWSNLSNKEKIIVF